MLNMTDSSNGTPQKAAASSLLSHRRVFATVPKNSPPALIEDVVAEENHSLVWPYQFVERHQNLHSILDRYSQQILYGCKNKNCQTPTCLSYQRRISKKPLRRFTVLSARILAFFIALQDDPKKSLCPHEPQYLSEATTDEAVQIPFDKPLSSGKASKSSACLRSTSVKVNPDSELPSHKNAKRHSSHKALEGKANIDKVRFDGEVADSDSDPGILMKRQRIPRAEKDFNSFTQNLFNSSDIDMLDRGEIPAFFLRWIPWLHKEKDNSLPEEVKEHMKNLMRAIFEPKAEVLGLSDKAECNPLVDKQEDKSAEVATSREPLSSKEFDGKYYHLEKTFPVPQKPAKRPTNTATALESSYAPNMSGTDSESQPRKRSIHSEHHDNAGTNRDAMSQATTSPQAPKALLQGSKTITRRNKKSQSLSSNSSDKLPTTIAKPRNEWTPKSPHTLQMFTLENTIALVDTVKNVHLKLHQENRFILRLGRTPRPTRLQSYVHCVPTPREREKAFGTQCIISILGSTDALSKSFLAHTDDTKVNKSVTFSEMVQAFQLLREIDYHPSNIFSSLWTSMRKVHVSTAHISKQYFAKSSKSFKQDGSLFNSSPENGSVSGAVLNDVEAAHIVKIALASLVASVPECSLDLWFEFQKLRVAGRCTPKAEDWCQNKDSYNLLLELADIFDDDMALNLLIKVVKAATARRWVSKMSHCQGPMEKGDEGSIIYGNDFISTIVQNIIDDSLGTSSNQMASSKAPKIESSPTEKIAKIRNGFPNDKHGQNFHMAVVVEWLRTIILKEWDGKAEVSRWSAIGGALEFMSSIYRLSDSLEMDPAIFQNLYLYERLEVMDMPTEWLASNQDRNTVHLLSYPFLFSPSDLLSFYRSINHASMFKAYEASIMAARLQAQITFVDPQTGRGELRLLNKLKRAISSFFVLVIRRENILTDALNQLWRRERRELMRPLKVRMGMDEGEEGVDHGGVQQEFFRISLSESLRPDYGVFTTDAEIQMSWFQPHSLEPLYKFELLGLLASLAVYNGITLPVTFPLALYRKLLDLPVTDLQHIEDGWPSLAKGLRHLLNYVNEDGGMDVEDVFLRSYVFSFETFGKTVFVDMDKVGREDDWPPSEESFRERMKESSNGRVFENLELFSSTNALSADGNNTCIASETSDKPKSIHSAQNIPRSRSNSTSSQACMVTEKNRVQYVNDYIFWLTDKSIRPQYEAFARGFYTCLDKKATTMFSPEMLKLVVEGTQFIDIDKLQMVARYEGGYHRGHPVIVNFWSVVRELPIENLRQLLEFVTASDRIPANGIDDILFVIQKNGTQDDRLPTSLTCFGRLLLPAYSSREVLKAKLYVALQNNKGFGVA